MCPLSGRKSASEPRTPSYQQLIRNCGCGYHRRGAGRSSGTCRHLLKSVKPFHRSCIRTRYLVTNIFQRRLHSQKPISHLAGLQCLPSRPCSPEPSAPRLAGGRVETVDHSTEPNTVVIRQEATKPQRNCEQRNCEQRKNVPKNPRVICNRNTWIPLVLQ